jgi:hypothetical protein
MHNETEIGRLIRDGEHLLAAEKLLEILRQNGGNVTHAAITAKVHPATFLRWLGRLREAGCVLAEKIEVIRQTCDKPDPLAGEEKARIRSEIRRERERSRVIAWLGRTDPQSIERVAKRAKVSVDIVARVASGRRTTADERERVVAAAARILGAQRAAWRRERALRLARAGDPTDGRSKSFGAFADAGERLLGSNPCPSRATRPNKPRRQPAQNQANP